MANVLGPIVGGLFGLAAAEGAGKDRQEAARINQATEQRKIEAAKAQPLGRNVTTGTGVTARPGGGFNIDFLPGSSQEEAAKGNVLRQQIATNLAGTTTAPTTEQINLAFDERDFLGRKDFEFGLNQLLSKRQQLGQGIQPGGGPFEGATVDAIGKYMDTMRRNTPIEKLTAKAEFDQRAANLQTAQLANLADRGVTPIGTPGANLAQLVANQPTTPTPTDFSGLTNLALAGGGVVQDFEKQRLAAIEEEKFNKVLAAIRRQVGGSGSGTFGLQTPVARV
jgi:hypothetical protein